MEDQKQKDKTSKSFLSWWPALLDGILALFIGVYGLLIGSLGILKGPLKLDRFLVYINVLAPMGLLSEAIRSAIEWRLGHFGEAIMKLERVVTLLEANALERGKVAREHVILVDFYTLLTRCYLHMGRVDEAMAVIIRAKKMLRRDYLKELVGVDAKTAQLVRAGIAAGRLFEGDGLATLFIKADSAPASAQNTTSERKGAVSKDESLGDNVIPFRGRDWEK